MVKKSNEFHNDKLILTSGKKLDVSMLSKELKILLQENTIT